MRLRMNEQICPGLDLVPPGPEAPAPETTTITGSHTTASHTGEDLAALTILMITGIH